MPADPQIQNVLSAVATGQRQLLDTIILLRGLRIRLTALDVAALTDDQFVAAITDERGAKGELSHMSSGKIRRLLAAMDALDAVLVAPAKLDGVDMPPVKAIVDVIR